jgi:hypothetical protein
MSSRSEVCVCEVCKQKYFEPERHPRRHVCGHCEIIRMWAQDGTPESAAAANEWYRSQRAKCIEKRPRCTEVFNDL